MSEQELRMSISKKIVEKTSNALIAMLKVEQVKMILGHMKYHGNTEKESFELINDNFDEVWAICENALTAGEAASMVDAFIKRHGLYTLPF